MEENIFSIILSGGGGHGAHQFGVLKYIIKVLKIKFNIIAGVSVGCLNGAALASNKFDQLENMWNTINNDSVYTGNTWLSVIWRLIRGKKSVFDNAPLLKQIQNFFSLKDFDQDINFHFGLVSLISGLYNSLTPNDFSNDIDLQNAILASATMPIVWEPVSIINLKNGKQLQQCVDGGLRNISPLGDIIKLNPTHIIIIDCSPLKESPDQNSANNIVNIAKRSLTDITINEIIRNDINKFIQINNLVKQAEENNLQLKKKDGSNYKSYKHILIQPDEDLGDSLDFSQSSIQDRINKGYNTAQKIFESNPDFLK